MSEQASFTTTQAIARRQVFLMALSCALAVSTIYYHQPLLPQMASAFGVTVVHGSLIATLTQPGYAMGLLLFVPLGDVIQPRKLASLAICANAVALIACAVADILLVGRMQLSCRNDRRHRSDHYTGGLGQSDAGDAKARRWFAAGRPLLGRAAGAHGERSRRRTPGLARSFSVCLGRRSVSPRIGAVADRIGTRNITLSGAITVNMAFAFVAAGGVSLSCLIVGMVLFDLGNRAALVSNQARIYTLRPEARSRLNTVLMVSYFLGGASGAELGSLGAHLDAWVGLAAVAALLSLTAAAVNALSDRQNSPELADERA